MYSLTSHKIMGLDYWMPEEGYPEREPVFEWIKYFNDIKTAKAYAKKDFLKELVDYEEYYEVKPNQKRLQWKKAFVLRKKDEKGYWKYADGIVKYYLIEQIVVEK